MEANKHRGLEAMNMLEGYIRDGKTVLIAGNIGSGKTTFLKELSCFIGKEDRAAVIGYKPDLQDIERENVVVWDRNEFEDTEALIDTVGEYDPTRLVFDEVRGGDVAPVLNIWAEEGKGLGTMIAASTDMVKSYLVHNYMDATLDTAPDAIEKVVNTIDVLVMMDYRSRMVSEVFLVDKKVKHEVALKRVYNNWA